MGKEEILKTLEKLEYEASLAAVNSDGENKNWKFAASFALRALKIALKNHEKTFTNSVGNEVSDLEYNINRCEESLLNATSK